MKKTAYLLSFIVLLGSCSVHKHDNNEQVLNKRKYRKGYYFHGFKKSNQKRPDPISRPNEKYKSSIKFTDNNDKDVTFHYSFRKSIETFEVLETEQEQLNSNSAAAAPVKNNIPTLSLDLVAKPSAKQVETKKIILKDSQEETFELEEIQMPKVSTGKYGSALGLNSIGVSLFSKIGINPEGNFPWLAYVIPAFIFISGSMLFFFGAKRKRKEKYQVQANDYKKQSIFSAFQNSESAASDTKNDLLLRATIYAIVISLCFFLIN